MLLPQHIVQSTHHSYSEFMMTNWNNEDEYKTVIVIS